MNAAMVHAAAPDPGPSPSSGTRMDHRIDGDGSMEFRALRPHDQSDSRHFVLDPLRLPCSASVRAKSESDGPNIIGLKIS